MAKLGDAFSDDQRRESVRRQLQPGAVIYIEVVFPEGRKPKYLVIAHVDHECTTFVINSRVNPFIEARPSLAACQVSMQSRARVRIEIEDSLDALPRAYTKETYQTKCNVLFEHVYESYMGDGKSSYTEAA